MRAANQDMGPGRDATARRACTNTGASGVQHVLGHFAGKDVATESGDHVTFKTDPVVHVVGEVRMKAAEICRKRSRVEMDEFITDAEVPAVAIVAGARRLPRRR